MARESANTLYHRPFPTIQAIEPLDTFGENYIAFENVFESKLTRRGLKN
jgi:hypothetical protein